MSNTEARTAKFKEFTQSDKLMAHEIQRKALRLQKLQVCSSGIKHFKHFKGII